MHIVPSRSKLETAFRFVLAGGGAIDAVAGLALAIAPAAVAGAIGVPVPADLYYVRLLGVAVSTLGVMFAHAATNPTRYAPVIYAAAAMRAGAAALLVSELARGTVPEKLSMFLPVEVPASLLHLAYAAWLMSRRETTVAAGSRA